MDYMDVRLPFALVFDVLPSMRRENEKREELE